MFFIHGLFSLSIIGWSTLFQGSKTFLDAVFGVTEIGHQPQRVLLAGPGIVVGLAVVEDHLVVVRFAVALRSAATFPAHGGFALVVAAAAAQEPTARGTSSSGSPFASSINCSFASAATETLAPTVTSDATEQAGDDEPNNADAGENWSGVVFRKSRILKGRDIFQLGQIWGVNLDTVQFFQRRREFLILAVHEVGRFPVPLDELNIVAEVGRVVGHDLV